MLSYPAFGLAKQEQKASAVKTDVFYVYFFTASFSYNFFEERSENHKMEKASTQKGDFFSTFYRTWFPVIYCWTFLRKTFPVKVGKEPENS